MRAHNREGVALKPTRFAIKNTMGDAEIGNLKNPLLEKKITREKQKYSCNTSSYNLFLQHLKSSTFSVPQALNYDITKVYRNVG